MAIKFDQTRDTAAEVAEEVCRRFAAGERGQFWINRISFELTDVAYCSEFVRECCEAAAGSGAFTLPYFGGTARETERKLRAAGKTVGEAKRGNIVCFNAGNAGTWGHIGLALGGGLYAENTSSKTRGPGFVVSKLADVAGRVSGIYQILPARKAEPTVNTNEPKIILLPGSQVIDCHAELQGGTTRCDLRALAEGLGYQVVDSHLQTQGKLYLRAPEVGK